MTDLTSDLGRARIDVAELLDVVVAHRSGATAAPGWAGVSTLFGAPLLAHDRGDGADEAASWDWVAAGVPFDGTTSSRPGAAEGPRAVRTSSLVYSSSLTTRESEPMVDMSTGRHFGYATPSLVDVGDLPIYPSDPLRTMVSVATGAREALDRGQRAVFLVGDHSGTFGTFMGYYARMVQDIDPSRIGFVNIDHHFDFGDTSALHGPIYHGSNSRRISELPGMLPQNQAYVGVGDATRSRQLASLRERGFHVITAPQITADPTVLDTLVETMSGTCDAVYVSLDIDVMDCSVAPGTGNVTLGGLSGAAMLDVWRRVHRLPVRAFDVAEIAPRYDPTGRTSQIAARLIFEALFHVQEEE